MHQDLCWRFSLRNRHLHLCFRVLKWLLQDIPVTLCKSPDTVVRMRCVQKIRCLKGKRCKVHHTKRPLSLQAPSEAEAQCAQMCKDDLVSISLCQIIHCLAFTNEQDSLACRIISRQDLTVDCLVLSMYSAGSPDLLSARSLSIWTNIIIIFL